MYYLYRNILLFPLTFLALTSQTQRDFLRILEADQLNDSINQQQTCFENSPGNYGSFNYLLHACQEPIRFKVLHTKQFFFYVTIFFIILIVLYEISRNILFSEIYYYHGDIYVLITRGTYYFGFILRCHCILGRQLSGSKQIIN